MINISVSEISGIGESRSKLLLKLGIKTVNDMLYFVPRQMEDRSEIKQIKDLRSGETAAVFAELITEVEEMRIRNNLVIYKAVASDGSGAVILNWFNNKYIKSSLKKGQKYKFYGKVEYKYGKFEMSGITYEKADGNTYIGRVVPIYPLTKNLPQKTMQSLMRICVEKYVGTINEYINEDIRKKYGLCEINFALRAIHFPCGKHEYEIARKRLIFEELMLFQLGILKVKKRKPQGEKFNTEGVFAEFAEMLPFELTAAQKNVIGEIYADLSGNVGMNRLVQGDVGSGKTLVAAACAYFAARNGFQTLVMAPTEVLAQQHCETFRSFLEPLGIKVGVLSGSMTAAEKKTVRQQAKEREIDVLVGTHALIYKSLTIGRLGLVVVDEQHRFGVAQRSMLAEQGTNPHIVAMSATPIPRTLALIMYGDLDVSVVNQMPKGRLPVMTYSVDGSFHQRVYNFIKKHIAEGRQAFIVCPRVESGEDESSDKKSAIEYYNYLTSGEFRGIPTGLLYGKMKPAEKDAVMEDFRSDKLKLLISTTVIEVGVDVPNAVVMLIENAEQFGLSQLHQLRGRVGRGAYQSYCILMTDNKSEYTAERMRAMCETTDGYKIADTDLKLRGPGNFFGREQSGALPMKVADLAENSEILPEIDALSEQILKSDPKLEKPEHSGLKQNVERLLGNIGSYGYN